MHAFARALERDDRKILTIVFLRRFDLHNSQLQLDQPYRFFGVDWRARLIVWDAMGEVERVQIIVVCVSGGQLSRFLCSIMPDSNLRNTQPAQCQ